MSKAHFMWKGFTIASDERDICIDGNYDYDIYKWCNEVNVNANIFMKMEGKSVWRIMDEKERAWFRLRWDHLSIPSLS